VATVTDQNISAAFKAIIDTAGVTAPQRTPGEVYYDPAHPDRGVAAWEGGPVLYEAPSEGTSATENAAYEVVAQLLALLDAERKARAADEATIASLQSQVAALQARLGGAPQPGVVDPSIVTALQAASQLLAPFASLATEVTAALKNAGA
jgi:hypothetical protein